MKEEALNSLLSRTKSGKKEMSKMNAQIRLKKKQLAELSSLFESSQTVELSIRYLLLKREVDRLERVSRILKREKHRDIENAWIREGKTEHEEEAKKFKEITKKYFNNFPSLSFIHREVPIEYYSHVQAVEDCGIVEIGGNLIETKKGSLYFVRKKDVTHLLAHGMMKVVKNEK